MRKMTSNSKLAQSIQTANETFGSVLDVRLSENETEVLFALPQKKVCWIAVIKGLILIGLIIGMVTWVIPFWLFVIVLFIVGQIYPLYKTFHRAVVDVEKKTVCEKWGFITTNKCSLAEYKCPLFYCLSVDGTSPIIEDFCLVFNEKGKRKELLVAHIGAKEAARTSANKETVLTLWELVLQECGVEAPAEVTPEVRLIHRNAIFK